jgi:hypothetical protein
MAVCLRLSQERFSELGHEEGSPCDVSAPRCEQTHSLTVTSAMYAPAEPRRLTASSSLIEAGCFSLLRAAGLSRRSISAAGKYVEDEDSARAPRVEGGLAGRHSTHRETNSLSHGAAMEPSASETTQPGPSRDLYSACVPGLRVPHAFSRRQDTAGGGAKVVRGGMGWMTGAGHWSCKSRPSSSRTPTPFFLLRPKDPCRSFRMPCGGSEGVRIECDGCVGCGL